MTGDVGDHDSSLLADPVSHVSVLFLQMLPQASSGRQSLSTLVVRTFARVMDHVQVLEQVFLVFELDSTVIALERLLC